jgi:protein tyrosine/serine phosphatase
MRFVHIPVSGWSPPTDEQVAEFLALFHSNPQQKIFVHCRLGEDRTGVLFATYRMALEKWTPEQAMKEMYFFGFNGFLHPTMKFHQELPRKVELRASSHLTAHRRVAL